MKGFRVVVLIPGFILSFAAWAAEKESGLQKFTAENIEILEPDCNNCAASNQNAELPKERVHPQGKLLDDITLRLMKDHARFNPNVPAGLLVPFSNDVPLQPAAPPIRSSFDGLNKVLAQGFFPPDTQIAVGPNHILQATNGGLRLSSKTNTNVQITDFNTFFAKPGVFLFDPKVFYDPFSGRFFVVILEFKKSPQVSFVRFAVSQSGSPASLTQGWCRYSYSGKSQGTWADYPSLGLNEKWMAINTNNFKFSDNLYVKALIKATDKTKLVNNATSCPKVTFVTFSQPLSSTSGTIQIANSYTTTTLSGTPLFAVSTRLGDSNLYELWRISGSGSTPTLTKQFLTGRSHSFPPDARHKSSGTDYDTDVNRVLHTVFRNGVLSFVFTTGCSFGSLPNESCVRVAQITPNDTSGTVTFEADYGGGNNKFFWMGAIAVNSSNDMAVIFQQSGTTSFLGTAYTGKKASAGNLEPFRLLQGGKCNLINVDPSDPRNRTGDYAGAATDPSDNRTFWFTAEYADNINGQCVWDTRIGKSSY